MARFLGVVTLICILDGAQSSGKKHKQRDSDNPDEQDYMQACDKVSVTYNADPNVAKTHINNVLQRLQSENLLPSDNPIAKARTICEDPTQENSRVCVFLRKNDMIDKIIADFSIFEEPGMARHVHLMYWCKHPECVTYTRDCHSVASTYEGLHGYVDCTDNSLVRSTEQTKTVQVIQYSQMVTDINLRNRKHFPMFL